MKSKAYVAIAATAVVMAMSLTPGAAFAADETTEPTTAVTAPAAEDQTPAPAPAEDGTSGNPGNPGAPVDEGTGTDGPQRGDAGAPAEGTGGDTTPTSPTEGTGTPTEGTGDGTTTPTAPSEGTGTTPTSPTEGTSTTPTEGTGTETGTTPTAPTEGTGTNTIAPAEGTGGGKGDAGAPTSPNGPQPVTSMESAYVALAGANAYYGAGPCVKFGSGSSTPGSTLALPSIREGAFLGWKITAENASTWALDWYACDAAGPAYDPNAGGGNGGTTDPGTNPGDGGNTGGGTVDPGSDGGSAPVDGGNAGTTVGTDAANALISTADSGSTDAGAVSAENASYERDAAEGTLAYTGGNTDGVGFIATIGALFAMLGALALRIQRRARNNA